MENDNKKVNNANLNLQKTVFTGGILNFFLLSVFSFFSAKMKKTDCHHTLASDFFHIFSFAFYVFCFSCSMLITFYFFFFLHHCHFHNLYSFFLSLSGWSFFLYAPQRVHFQLINQLNRIVWYFIFSEFFLSERIRAWLNFSKPPSLSTPESPTKPKRN